MKVKKVVEKLEELKDHYDLPFETEEQKKGKKVVKALDEAIDAVKENKKLREKNEKLEEKVEKLKAKIDKLKEESKQNTLADIDEEIEECEDLEEEEDYEY